jgi:hypothetical protein
MMVKNNIRMAIANLLTLSHDGTILTIFVGGKGDVDMTIETLESSQAWSSAPSEYKPQAEENSTELRTHDAALDGNVNMVFPDHVFIYSDQKNSIFL